MERRALRGNVVREGGILRMVVRMGWVLILMAVRRVNMSVVCGVEEGLAVGGEDGLVGYIGGLGFVVRLPQVVVCDWRQGSPGAGFGSPTFGRQA
jgi:hypothetical protein